jgi:DNA-binding NtrC family response regulator
VAIERTSSSVFDLVITDVRLPGAGGLEIFRAVRRSSPSTEVILMTSFATVSDAVEALKTGAYDYLTKPFDLDELIVRVGGIAKKRALVRELEEARARLAGSKDADIVGESPAMARLLERVDTVAASDASVLLSGESGTGKELVARRLHARSPRVAAPFITINCGAFPETLLEAELFGHERGAFTGAGARKIGKLELAHRGTLFLDEIGELPLAVQSKLLRVLEEKRFERVGGTQEIEVNVRILTATNKDLRAAVADKTFREDLYFRISAVPITIPPLRDRGDDVLLLAEHFLERFKREFRKPALALTEDARERLLTYPWPGNVRELQNAIERAAILANGSDIDVAGLQLPSARPTAEQLPEHMVEDEFLWEGPLEEVSQRALAHVERFKIQNALRETKWNKTRAAEKLGVSYKTLLHKIRNLGLDN